MGLKVHPVLQPFFQLNHTTLLWAACPHDMCLCFHATSTGLWHMEQLHGKFAELPLVCLGPRHTCRLCSLRTTCILKYCQLRRAAMCWQLSLH